MSFHLYDVNELYSNADGSIQFIELTVGNANGEDEWNGKSITVSKGATNHVFTFSSSLPSNSTANTSVLIATQGFADLGIVTPDFIVPSGFLFVDGGTVNFAGVDSVSYAALPIDGILSVNRNGNTAVNSPTNFAGASGTVLDSPPMGTDGADILNGGSGDDTISGLGGNDILNGGAGDDTLDGNSGNDTLNGEDGNDTLTGGSGIDLLIGGSGNDTYVIDSDTEIDKSLADGDVDTVKSSVSYTLGAQQERLILTGSNAIDGTGNTSGNKITGNSNANIISGENGSDTLKGGGGDDTLNGNNGSDNLNGGGGDDDLEGGDGDDKLDGKAGNDNLSGGSGDDLLIGHKGKDTLDGGDGSDTYVVHAKEDSADTYQDSGTGTGDVDTLDAANVPILFLTKVFVNSGLEVIEGAVTKTILASNVLGLTWDFSDTTLINIKKIDGSQSSDQITGSLGNDKTKGLDGNDVLNGSDGNDKVIGGNGDDSVIGGDGNDVVKGNAGNDELNGGNGSDKLIGGGQEDTFIFDTALGTSNVDTIVKFNPVDDVIVLDDDIFTSLTTAAGNTLSASEFVANSSGMAVETGNRIIYNINTGELFYDADGSGENDPVQFALLTTAPTIDMDDFLVIG